MSQKRREEAFLKSARFFPWVAVIGAVVILASALAAAYVEYSVYSARFANMRTSAGAGVTTTRVNQMPAAVASVARFIERGLPAALLVVAAGIVVRFAAHLAAGGERPHWAPRLDERFKRRAEFFAKTTHAAAWVVLAVLVAGMAFSAYEIVRQSLSLTGMSASAAFRGACLRVNLAASSLAAGLRTFFVLMLGTMLVRALLVLSEKNGAGVDV